MYPVLISLHILFVLGWLSGLFYLPRLFVYHASLAHQDTAYALLLRMERNLYRFAAVNMGMTFILGFFLAWKYGWYNSAWFHIKLIFVFLLMLYQWGCRYLMRRFSMFESSMSGIQYRFFNEIPLLFVFAILWLVTAKPSLLV